MANSTYTNPYVIIVYGEAAIGETLRPDLLTRENKFPFIVRKSKNEPYTNEEYEKIFYKELKRLLEAIKYNTGYTYLIDGKINNPMIRDKFKIFLSGFKNVQLNNLTEEKVLWVGYINLTCRLHLEVYSNDSRVEFLKESPNIKEVMISPPMTKSEAIDFFNKNFNI